MNALFAPFRSKKINPNDWTSKMEFWVSLIEKYCKYYKSPSFEPQNLKSKFSRKGVVPACFDEVVEHLKKYFNFSSIFY